MKHTKNMIYKPSEKSRELYLYTVNTQQIYYKTCYIVRSLARKFKKGVYDSNKAIDAYYSVVNESAALYNKEFSSYGYKCFSVTDKYTVATELEKYYFENVQNNDL